VTSSNASKWIEAGKILSADPSAKVRCPNCEGANLVVIDLASDADPSLLERVMQCPSCGERNILRLKRPKPEASP